MGNYIKKTVAIIFILCSFSAVEVSAQLTTQQNYDNLYKYWYYRFRLKNDFLKVGNCQGCGIPASERYNFKTNELNWGDSPSQLAYYIGVLATEYKLLRDNNLDLTQTGYELMLALKALKRIDYTAESYFGGSNNVNGFLLRDDVPCDFLQNNSAHFNSECTEHVSYYKNNSALQTSSDYCNGLKPPTPENPTPEKINEFSQDHATQILFGLALVKGCINSSDNYNGYYFLAEAQNLATKLVKWIQNAPGGWNKRWIIENAVTGDPVDRGSKAYAMAFGFASAACFINGKGKLCSDFHDIYTYNGAGGGFWLWKMYLFFGVPSINCSALFPKASSALNTCTDSYMPLTLAAIGNSSYTVTSIGPLLGVPNTSNAMYKAFVQDFQHLPLTWAFLYGKNLKNQLGQAGPLFQPYIEFLLNDAPCEGPWYYADTATNNYLSPSYEWSTKSRFLHPHKRGYYPYTKKNPGEYNGLDYMLYHNLYYLNYGGSNNLITPVNLEDRIVRGVFPINLFGFQFGSKQRPALYEAINTITSDATLNPNADVTFKAGKEITLSSGFTATIGSEFHAFIESYSCFNTRRESNDSAKKYFNDYSYIGIHNHIGNVSNVDSAKESQIVQEQIDISVFPNPTNNNYHIVFSLSKVSTVEINLTDLNGRIIKQLTNQKYAEGFHELSSDASELTNGVYLIQFKSSELNKVIKLVVNK